MKLFMKKSLLQYSFIGDLFLIADDPMGRRGPNIDEFLSVKAIKNAQNKTNSSNQAISNSVKISSLNLREIVSEPTFQPLMKMSLNFTSNQPIQAAQSLKMHSNFNTKNEKPNFTSAPVKTPRAAAHTENLYRMLTELYPNLVNQIRILLEQNVSEIDENFFIAALSRVCFYNNNSNNNSNNQSVPKSK